MNKDTFWVSIILLLLTTTKNNHVVSGNFSIYLFIQSLINFGIICLGLTVPDEYCYTNNKCRWVMSRNSFKWVNFLISRYPNYIYQLDLSSHILIMVSYFGLGFFVTRYEELLKKHPWSLYLISILSVCLIEVTF